MSDLWASKKFRTSVFTALIPVAREAMIHLFGVEIPVDTMLAVMAPGLTYTVAQGVSDHGKERAKVEANGRAGN